MTLKIIGSSFRNDLVYCSECDKRFAWLNCYLRVWVKKPSKIIYVAICRECRLRILKDRVRK